MSCQLNDTVEIDPEIFPLLDISLDSVSALSSRDVYKPMCILTSITDLLLYLLSEACLRWQHRSDIPNSSRNSDMLHPTKMERKGLCRQRDCNRAHNHNPAQLG